MGKTKKKSGGTSNASKLGKSDLTKVKKQKKQNPFEIRFVKEKHQVLNRKLKTDVGKPGISRAKAIQKRKDTLLQEYKRRNKNNVFLDKRIGEKDSSLSAEDKMIARFAAERNAKGKSLFNLGEEETLTHFGKSLAEIETFEDPKSDDDDDLEGEGGGVVGANFVEETHFGGFLTKSDVEFASGKSNTRKEWIDEMIAESKRKKAERHQEMEAAIKATHSLDDEWKNLLKSTQEGLTMGMTRNAKKKDMIEEDMEGGAKDDYNILMKELQFAQKRALAQDRLKTEEEVIKENKEKLERQESERVKRMNGGDRDEEEEEESENDGSDVDEEKEVTEKAEGESEEGSDEEEDSDSDEDDKYSDLQESDDEPEVQTPKKTSKARKNKKNVSSKADDKATPASDLPFTFKLPESYEELEEHFEGRSPSDKATIVDRMIKCNHPQFGGNNKAGMETLFRLLLQHLHDCGTVDDSENAVAQSMETVSMLTPYMFDLCKFNPAPCAKAVLSVIQEKYQDFCKKTKVFPTLESLIFMKLVVLLFPSSDYRHPVVTPTLQWMSHILGTAKAKSRFGFTVGLYICGVFLEAVQLSRRYSPEVTNFLVGILDLCCPEEKGLKSSQVLLNHVPPFRPVGPESTVFHDLLRGDCEPERLQLRETTDDEVEVLKIDSSYAASVLHTTLKLLSQAAQLWKDLSAAKPIFRRLARKLESLPTEKLHPMIKEVHDQLSITVQDIMNRKGPNVSPSKSSGVAQKQVTMLRLYEPEIDDDFDPFQKKRVGSREKLEMDKLLHKVKRERKAAKKDLRKDTAFLAKQKAKEARERDVDRQKKTKEIMGGLGSQEGEYRKFMASKKRKK